MKSNSFYAWGVVILVLGISGGLLLLTYDSTVGLTTIGAAVSSFFVLQFFSSVLEHLEVLTSGKREAPPIIERITGPYVPDLDKAARSAAVERIAQSGFKSTSKTKYDNYLIAVDENRREWVVITPDGGRSEVRPYSQYGGSLVSIIDDSISGACLGVEVIVSIDEEDDLHIILYGRNSHLSETRSGYAARAHEIARLLDSITEKVDIS